MWGLVRYPGEVGRRRGGGHLKLDCTAAHLRPQRVEHAPTRSVNACDTEGTLCFFDQARPRPRRPLNLACARESCIPCPVPLPSVPPSRKMCVGSPCCSHICCHAASASCRTMALELVWRQGELRGGEGSAFHVEVWGLLQLWNLGVTACGMPKAQRTGPIMGGRVEGRGSGVPTRPTGPVRNEQTAGCSIGSWPRHTVGPHGGGGARIYR